MVRPPHRAPNFQRNLTCTITLADGRQLVTLRDAGTVDLPALESLGLRGVARPAPTSFHLIVGPDAAATLHGLRGLIASEA